MAIVARVHEALARVRVWERQEVAQIVETQCAGEIRDGKRDAITASVIAGLERDGRLA